MELIRVVQWYIPYYPRTRRTHLFRIEKKRKKKDTVWLKVTLVKDALLVLKLFLGKEASAIKPEKKKKDFITPALRIISLG